MSKYKLFYFPFPGRGELIRFIFAQAGVEYEDYRIPYEKWVAEIKPTMPFGYVPVLEVDGRKLSSSGGIARFLAERFGLAGSNDIENAEIWAIMEVILDTANDWIKVRNEKDETRKGSLKKDYQEKVLPKALSKLEKFASENGTAEGWIYGKKVTYADFAMYLLSTEVLQRDFPNVFDDYPTLAKLKKSVEQLPNIAKWLQERPKPIYPPS